MTNSKLIAPLVITGILLAVSLGMMLTRRSFSCKSDIQTSGLPIPSDLDLCAPIVQSAEVTGGLCKEHVFDFHYSASQNVIIASITVTIDITCPWSSKPVTFEGIGVILAVIFAAIVICRRKSKPILPDPVTLAFGLGATGVLIFAAITMFNTPKGGGDIDLCEQINSQAEAGKIGGTCSVSTWSYQAPLILTVISLLLIIFEMYNEKTRSKEDILGGDEAGKAEAWLPNQPYPAGAWNPNQAGAWHPNQPYPTGAWNPNQAGPVGAWNPNQPQPVGAWNPNQPQPTGAWNPNQPQPAGTWNPNQPQPAGV